MESHLMSYNSKYNNIFRMKKNNIYNQIYEKLNSDEKFPEDSKGVNMKKDKKQEIAEDVFIF